VTLCEVGLIEKRDAAKRDLTLPLVYQVYYRRWFALGWAEFIGALVIFYLMVAKPGF
jgi:uncharacterized membrane protein